VWVRVVIDGVQLSPGNNIPAGETVTLEAKEKIAIRVGKANALDIKLNGYELPKLSERSEPKNAEYTLESVKQLQEKYGAPSSSPLPQSSSGETQPGTESQPTGGQTGGNN
jgi:hypothetical protein